VAARPREKIASREMRIREDQYIQALENRRVPREKLAGFAGQQRHIIQSDLQSVGLIVARAGSQEARDCFMGMLQGYELLYWDTMFQAMEA
jgi:hypothetical protein